MKLHLLIKSLILAVVLRTTYFIKKSDELSSGHAVRQVPINERAKIMRWQLSSAFIPLFLMPWLPLLSSVLRKAILCEVKYPVYR